MFAGLIWSAMDDCKIFIRYGEGTEKLYKEDKDISDVKMDFNVVGRAVGIEFQRSDTIQKEKKHQVCFYSDWIKDPEKYLVDKLEVKENVWHIYVSSFDYI